MKKLPAPLDTIQVDLGKRRATTRKNVKVSIWRRPYPKYSVYTVRVSRTSYSVKAILRNNRAK